MRKPLTYTPFPLPLDFGFSARLAGFGILLFAHQAFAGQPMPEEVFGILGMTEENIRELAEGRPVAYVLDEGRADELSVGIARYLPLPSASVADRLKRDEPAILDVDVSARGELSVSAGVNQLGNFQLPKEEAEALIDVAPGDEFNLSTPEIERFTSLKGVLHKGVLVEVEHRYREMLFQRFEAYLHRGTYGLAVYAREAAIDSSPALELRQAASENKLLSHYQPDLHQAWLNYPSALPKGAEEKFLWINKTVEGRPAAILRHRVETDWGGGALVLTREFYTAHSYNSSQWLTGCLPWHNGTVVFQQVRTFTDQVAGVASEAKHLIGRELLKGKMLKNWELFHDRLTGKMM